MTIDVSDFGGAVILLLIAGVAAALFTVFMVLDFLKNKKMFHLLWAIAFFVVFAAGFILVISNDFLLLLKPMVAVLAAFIPGGIASGLYYTESKKYGLFYLIFVCIGAVLIGIAKYVPSLADITPFAVMLVHIPSSLSMIGIPIYTYVKKINGWPALLVSIGGFLISIAGVMLAFLTLGSDLFSRNLIFTLLSPILLVVAVCFALGFVLTKKWTFKTLPFLDNLVK